MKNAAITVLITLGAALLTFALTAIIGMSIAYVRLHGDRDPSWVDSLAWMFVFGWPILVPVLLGPALIVGVVAGIIRKKQLNEIRLSKSATR
ncbi:hypothetical protein [Bradyrhizobium sp. S69]|uniref:hypothetical protein n=1 Tax=Bradyrhizobium sp. S69 TaxID=1641856 RepID=UPI00131E4C60|nr:hypothetical protein [Bradyrhizobium sp. S69]